MCRAAADGQQLMPPAGSRELLARSVRLKAATAWRDGQSDLRRGDDEALEDRFH